MTGQLKLDIIPEYADSRLYTDLQFIKKNKQWISTAGYSGKKTLVFYNSDEPPEHFGKYEIMSIDFPNFKEAYEFILRNKIKNFNIREDCYKDEIKQYLEEQENERKARYVL